MTARTKPWDKNLQLLLTAIVAFNVAPHIGVLPIWVIALAGCAILWKFLYLTKGLELPKKSWLRVATAAATVGVLTTYQTLFGQEAAGALLLAMASLKLLETNRYRDAMLMIFTSYFLLMTHLLNSQSLASTFFMLIDVIAITGLMAQMHRRERGQSAKSFAPALRLMAFALPLWVFFFFLFPRFSVGLFNLKPAEAASGFSDHLDPGAISRIVESDEPVFRVRFSNGEVATNELYWRGAILTNGNGLRWSKAPEGALKNDDLAEDVSPDDGLAYQIWMEPGFQKWLFVLDFPVEFNSVDLRFLSRLRRKPGFIFESANALVTRVTYSARSQRVAPQQNLPEASRAPFLALPAQLDPRVLSLARTLSSQSSTRNEVREIAMAKTTASWLVNEGFRYTKSPGTLSSNDGVEQLTEFLFSTKIGYCEHFAAAFATLMRAAGIPSRVVVGFLGASANDIGSFWLVRQLDAHAWTEIWVHDAANSTRGRWVRFDPTEYIAPLRLQLGGDFNRVDEKSLLAGITGEELQRRLQQGLLGWIRRAQAAWDAVQMRWNSFLLEYDFEFQKRLLERLGIKQVSRILLVSLLVGFTLLFGFLLTRLLSRRARHRDPVLTSWHRFCAEFARHGLNREPNEGPLAFAERAVQRWPDRAAQIFAIAASFAQLRYGKDRHSAAALRTFHQSVRRFSIKESSRATSS